MAITHKLISTQPESIDPSKVRTNDWNDEHNIDHGIAVLDATGMAIITNDNTPTFDRILLSRQSGNSNMSIYVSDVVEGIGFTITSAGGQDDWRLSVPWFFL